LLLFKPLALPDPAGGDNDDDVTGGDALLEDALRSMAKSQTSTVPFREPQPT
jgi:hypothetical protein